MDTIKPRIVRRAGRWVVTTTLFGLYATWQVLAAKRWCVRENKRTRML